LVCEYCNGGSLKEYLKKKGALAESEALLFFKVPLTLPRTSFKVSSVCTSER
jgi:hypothetical protein